MGPVRGGKRTVRGVGGERAPHHGVRSFNIVLGGVIATRFRMSGRYSQNAVFQIPVIPGGFLRRGGVLHAGRFCAEGAQNYVYEDLQITRLHWPAQKRQQPVCFLKLICPFD